jgi:hypothetical protein
MFYAIAPVIAQEVEAQAVLPEVNFLDQVVTKRNKLRELSDI